MGDSFSGDSVRKKAEFVAEVVNHTLHDLVIRCTKTEEVRNYYHVSVIGYGRTVSSCFSGPLAARDMLVDAIPRLQIVLCTLPKPAMGITERI